MIMKLTQEKISMFRLLTKEWGETNVVDYPWRNISDPYLVLMSEFLLHRTQTDQVLPIYLTMIKYFPDLKSFYNAPPDDIRVIMKPLGLSWRCNCMIEAFHILYETYGMIPLVVTDLLAIKGIGPYVANATVCFSINSPLPLVDTNIVRVVGRFVGLELSGEPRRRKETRITIESIVDPLDPRSFYYSVIDFAHQVCKSRKPYCEFCEFAKIGCVYRERFLYTL